MDNWIRSQILASIEKSNPRPIISPLTHCYLISKNLSLGYFKGKMIEHARN